MEDYKNNVVNYSLVRETTELLKTKIKSSRTVHEFILPIYKSLIDVQEILYLVTLNNSNEINGYVEVSRGTINSTNIDLRILLKYAISSLSTSIILIHNHPSGKLIPSSADEALTAKVKKYLKEVNITLLDHLIVTSSGYYSFNDNDIL